MINAFVNGIECKLCYDERFSPEHAPPGYPYMYQIRHDEDDWIKPIMLEKRVVVNFWGTVFMKEPIEFNDDSYINIDRFDMDSDYIIFEGTPAFFSKIFGINT